MVVIHAGKAVKGSEDYSKLYFRNKSMYGNFDELKETLRCILRLGDVTTDVSRPPDDTLRQPIEKCNSP